MARKEKTVSNNMGTNISDNSNITMADILNNPDFSWNWSNISYNINDEIVGFLNDLKKHSLLFGILNLIKNKSKK